MDRAIAGDLTCRFDFARQGSNSFTYFRLPSAAHTARFDAAQQALPAVVPPSKRELVWQEASR